ncbi:hypothetical protein Eyrgjafa_gp_23 [Pelagibacter phage Eyrgjafa EXVC018P]|uniref:Uncharacterized protein n=1 Tax=Pelagibacter phage Eyrgjafa EXVC018P TaxID=2736227 RepID=A0A7S5Y942_9CAUD|nr:hypothetical protein Eyrgjafa_gp_23 [Pelagibacter phage Eyrgjafa EXVC018P]QLF88228.1 hypothetical protein Gjalp_gp36 [Pelagibacter phage Gjalp EXVC020P]
MGRKKTELNLQAELPEVRSTDFNLFYKPEQAPVDKSVDIFTKSLDNFINGAGTGMVLSAEKKQKEINEAEALKQFNDNRTGFNKAVENGEIPKEANPYFQEKYKELTLNKKANEFKANIYQRYAEQNVLDQPDPQAFDKFYNDELKKFLTENNLGAFDALQLEKGFFSETSKTRNSLFNTHVQSQMSKIGEDYKLGFKESIQGKFDKNRTNEEIGADISAFVQDAVTNGLGKTTAQKYLLESLKEYAETTGDLEFAEGLLRDLPNHLKLGTDALGNVKGLQNDFDAIKEKIDDRILQRDKDENTKLQLQESNDILEASEFADKYDTLSEALEDPEVKKFSRNKYSKLLKEYEEREVEFDSTTQPYISDEVYKLLEQNKYAEAQEYINKNRGDITSNDFYKFKDEINSFKFAEKDGLLASGYYKHWYKEIEGLTGTTNKQKFGVDNSKIDALEHKMFEAQMKVWLKNHPIDSFDNPSDRKEAFEKHVKSEYEKVLEKALTSNITLDDGTITTDGESNTPIIEDGKKKKIKANKEDLTSSVEEPVKKKSRKERRNTKPVDPDLTKDMTEVVIVPEGLTGNKLRKFRRDNPNSMSQEEYDRIVQKQTANQTAQLGSE